MSFGLCNAPSTFQRGIELLLRGFQWAILLIYLDNVIITGKTFHEHLNNLGEVLSRFPQFGFKLKATTCNLFKDEILFPGHVVGKDGIHVHVNPSLVQDVEMWPLPQNVNELKAFLGLTNYYKRFMKDFADISRPLHNLTRKVEACIWKEKKASALLH